MDRSLDSRGDGRMWLLARAGRVLAPSQMSWGAGLITWEPVEMVREEEAKPNPGPARAHRETQDTAWPEGQWAWSPLDT